MIVSAPVTHIKLIEYDPPEDAADRQVWDECVVALRRLDEAQARVRAPIRRLSNLSADLYDRYEARSFRVRQMVDRTVYALDHVVGWLDANVLHYTRDKALWWAIQRSIGTPREVQIRLTDWVDEPLYSVIGEAEADLRDEAMRPMGEDEP